MIQSFRLLQVASLLGLVLVFVGTGQAQTNNFTGVTGGQWNVGTNWSLGTFPTSSQNVFSTNGTEVRIGSTTAAVAGNLTIGGASGNSIVALRNDTSNSLTVSGNITLAPGAGNGQLTLGTGAGFTSTLTIGGGSGSILDGGGAGASRIAVFGHMGTLGLATATADELNLNQNSSGSLTIGSGQTYTIGTTRVGSTNNNVTDALTVNGTLVGTTINPGASVANGTNNATFTLNTGGLVQATTLRRSGSQDITFDWNGGTIQNKSGGNLTVDATNGTTLTISLAGTGTHTFEADSGRTITMASTATLVDKAGENGTLTKAGAGVLALNGSNTHSGVTTVNAGTLGLGHVNALQNSTLDTGASGSQSVAFTATGTSTYNLGGLRGSDDLSIGANTISVGSNSASTTFAGVISGTNGSLTKVGNGTMTLTGNNTYTGTTRVSGGTLLVNNTSGSGTGAGAVSVASGAGLGGSGFIAGATTLESGSTLRPGNSPGLLTFQSNLTLQSDAGLVWELWANTEVNSPLAFDQIVVGGNLFFNGSNGVTLDFGTAAGGSLVSWADTFWDSQRSWIIYDVTGMTSGAENLNLLNTNYNDSLGQSLTSQRAGASFALNQVGQDIVLNYIPEPSSGSLLLAGLLVLQAVRRKRA